MLRKRRSEVIGKTIMYFKKSQAAIMDPYVHESMDRKQPVSVVHEFFFHGKIQFYDCIYNPISDERGNVVAFALICRNVMAKEYERSSLKEVLNDEYLKSIKHLQNLVFKLKRLENGDIIFQFSEGIIVHVLRITTDRVLGKTAKEVFQADIAQIVEEHYQMDFLGKVVYIELKLS